ncbi:MAG: 23S rRNA (pseudouridine(1915)-N(3))-methyltransferase RlmH [Oscillospiraceae bacterium]|nr:23S rRNA (pseudouridine(1915)-N(3))-methyltransferase RlmH [Oscillospiraceae bacterium]
MMNVNLIVVGKLKESYFREACAEYSKRLKAFCRLSVTELAESRLSDDPSEKEVKSALAAEGKAMKNFLSGKDCFNIALCIEGTRLSSEKLAEKIGSISVSGKSTLNFIIGSSFGIDNDIKKMCDLKLSMSEMTFPHMLARVMVLEQIYRAFQILNGGKYHK